MDILPQLLVNALISGSIYALACVGLALTYGLLGVLNFAHGHLMMLGAYLFYAAYEQGGLGLASSFFCMVAGCIVCGFVFMRIFVIPFMQQSPLLTFVTTLSLATILESIISMTFGVNVKSLSVPGSFSSYEIGSIFITPVQIVIIAVAIVVLGLTAVVVHATSLGRKLRALNQNPIAAEALATPRRRLLYGTFIVGVVLAGVAGLLVGCETNLQPTMGTAYTVKAFAAMILGGLGSVWGSMVGAFLLGLIENLAIGLDFGGYSLPAGYKDAFAYSIILVMLLFRPQGLFGSKQRSL